MRQAIIVSVGTESARVALWAAVPASAQVGRASPLAESIVPDLSAAELAAIRAGAVAEREIEVATQGRTLAQIRESIETAWQAYKQQTEAERPTFEGAYWDGDRWHLPSP